MYCATIAIIIEVNGILFMNPHDMIQARFIVLVETRVTRYRALS